MVNAKVSKIVLCSIRRLTTFSYLRSLIPFNMKNIFTPILTLCLLNSFGNNGDNEQKIKAPVESVVVYLDGAEITQSKTVTFEAGRNTIVFTGISSHLLSKSIQINPGPDVSILSISDKINYLDKP